MAAQDPTAERRLKRKLKWKRHSLPPSEEGAFVLHREDFDA